MKAGEFPDGTHVLRAKIDMQSGNVNMRDPVLYRIRHAHHQRTGDEWCIYPMYDYAHPISDAMEKITHSLCTLEFQDHRPLYDWFIENLPVPAKPVVRGSVVLHTAVGRGAARIMGFTAVRVTSVSRATCSGRSVSLRAVTTTTQPPLADLSAWISPFATTSPIFQPPTA